MAKSPISMLSDDTVQKQFEQIVQLLPVPLHIPLKDEVDIYGARHYVAAKAGRTVRGRSFTSWRHGWTPFKQIFHPRQITGNVGFCHNHLVIDDEQKAALKRFGRKNVHAVGLPFIYVDEAPPPRIPDSLLLMPTHSYVKLADDGSYEDVKLQQINDRSVFEYALELRQRIGLVVVSLYGADYRRTEALRKEFAPKGVHAIMGATGTDCQALVRMWRLFHSFEYVSTNGIGSQLLYGNLCGCKTSISGRYVEYEKEDFAGVREIEARPDIRDAYIACYREANMRSQLGFLFHDDPLDADVHADWAATEAGVRHRRSYDEICDLLDWRWPKQLIGYTGRAWDKLQRLVEDEPRYGDAV